MMLTDEGMKIGTFAAVTIPEEFGPVMMKIDDHVIKAYAFAQDDYLPWYFDQSPLKIRIGHATLLCNDLLRIYFTKYDSHTVVGLHASDMTSLFCPIQFGEIVALTGRFTHKEYRRGKGYVTLRSEAHGEDGRLIARQEAEIIIRTLAGETQRGTSQEVSDAIRVEYEATEFYAQRAAPSVTPGTPLLPLRKRLWQDQASLFSRIGEYDRNLHNDLEKAHDAGLPRPIAQGLHQTGYFSELLTRYFGLSWFYHGRLGVKHLRQVPVDTDIEVRGVVVGRTTEGSDTRVEVNVCSQDSESNVLSVGRASCLLDDSWQDLKWVSGSGPGASA